jgi:hypothetical protein
MKKIYFQPKTIVDLAQCEMLLAASMFDHNAGTQSITPSSDEPYNGEFSVKEYSFGDDFAN